MDAPGTRASNRRLAAQQGLAERKDFRLNTEALDDLERINQRTARSLKGLRELMDRPSQFQE